MKATPRRTGLTLAAPVVLAAVLAGCGSHSAAPAASAPTSGSSTAAASSAAVAPTATDVGITATQIHIAVVADVDSTLEPGLFQASVDAVKGFATEVNAMGGLAGRQLVVDFYDSKLNPNEGTNAVTEACANDFAMVGNYSVATDDFTPVNGCKDSTGKATGLPDIPGGAISATEQQSPVMYTPSPPEEDYTTKTQRAAVGQYAYYKKSLGATSAIEIYAANTPSAKAGSLALIAGLDKIGLPVVSSFGFQGNETNSAYDAVVSAAKTKSVNVIINEAPFTSGVQMQAESAVQGYKPKVFDCSTCYDPNYTKVGGASVSGTYEAVTNAPLESASTVKGVSEYVKAISPKVGTGFGEDSFAAALLFRQAVQQVVATSGNNGLTRAALLQALASIHSFTGDGIVGPTDVGGRVPSGCFAEMHLTGTTWSQVYPSTLGKLDCTPSNIVDVPASS
jgi:ABC-type branched-subunit amino acid transport system substrate-binding protein